MICPCQHASPHPGGAPYSVFPGNNEQNAEGVDHNHGESEGYPDPHTRDKKPFVPVADDKKPDDGPAATISLATLTLK